MITVLYNPVLLVFHNQRHYGISCHVADVPQRGRDQAPLQPNPRPAAAGGERPRSFEAAKAQQRDGEAGEQPGDSEFAVAEEGEGEEAGAALALQATAVSLQLTIRLNAFTY